MSIHYLPPVLLPKVRSKILTDEIGKMPCAARVSSLYPGHQCSGRDTVIGAHAPTVGKGTSTKSTDLAVLAACFNCHEIIDMRDKRRSDWIMEHAPAAFMDRMLQGVIETQARLLQVGIITVKGGEIVE